MSYRKIDPIINDWACEKKLQVFTFYKDYEVRSIDLVDATGNRYQIWIEELDNEEKIGIHAWDYNKKKYDCFTTVPELHKCLDEIYQIVKKWML